MHTRAKSHFVGSHRLDICLTCAVSARKSSKAQLVVGTTALLVGEPPSAVLVQDSDDESLGATLPRWAARRPMHPPTSSKLLRTVLFERIRQDGRAFETFANCGDSYKPPECFKCPVCLELLEDPSNCAGCERMMCKRCWQKHYGNGGRGCPLCRHPQPIPHVNRTMAAVLAHELSDKGITFQCNQFVPGTRSYAMWCCNRSFDSLAELQEHLGEQGSFSATQKHIRRLLKLCAHGFADARKTLFEEPENRQKVTDLLLEDEAIRRAARTTLRYRSRSPRSRDPLRASSEAIGNAL